MNPRRKLMTATALAAAATPLTAWLNPASAADEKVQLMFVQSAESLKADDKTLRLVNVSPQTIWFTDRPVRKAGHVTMANYMKEWTAAAGKDNFSKDPPNATLSVYEAGQAENTLTVVENLRPEGAGQGPCLPLQADRGQGAGIRRRNLAVHRLDRPGRRRGRGLSWCRRRRPRGWLAMS